MQPVDKGALPFKNFVAGDREREPFGAVDLRKRLVPPALRRPYHFKGVAYDGVHIEIGLDCERVNTFAAALTDFAERPKRSCGGYPKFFRELAPRDVSN